VNDYLLSVLLGIIEGLTEFLPVSSTAHLRIAEALAARQGWNIDLADPYWKMYTVVIQLGAILALPVYFGPRLMKFLRSFPRGERGDRNVINHPLSLVMIAFVCTAVPALLLKKVISQNLESLTVIGAALLIGGVVMWAVDAMFRKPTTLHTEEMTFGQAVWIGLCQTIAAVFPGTSRSMATIASGQVAGMSRTSALEFSFFLSIPTMLAATGNELYRAIKPKAGHEADMMSPLHVTSHQWVLLAIGIVVSFVVALAVVAWFMGWVRKRGFTPFAIYRIVLGAAVLIWVWRGGGHA
jgi:undecaprenyl-diphosphatase